MARGMVQHIIYFKCGHASRKSNQRLLEYPPLKLLNILWIKLLLKATKDKTKYEYKMRGGITKVVHIQSKRFGGKKNVPWTDVEEYLKGYIGIEIENEEYKDRIIIPKDFPDEYTGSRYTKKLHGAVALAKANAVLGLKELIKSACNRRFVENMDKKHGVDASEGWYRYDIFFSLPAQGENEERARKNIFRGTLIVRRNVKGNELYDIVNIKKEASKPHEP